MAQNLYSYCILHDDGAAPNPFWGLCTLGICKPKIRKSAKIGDWIAATGSLKYGFQNQLVYAMKVTGKMTFEEYDIYCRRELPEKIPSQGLTKDLRKKVGDCLYDYSMGKVMIREWGVHQLENMSKDLSGMNVLLSDHFYYFGSNPAPLPIHLLNIVKQGQGHKVKANIPYVEEFIEWITTFKSHKNFVSSSPYGLPLFKNEKHKTICGKLHLQDDEMNDQIIDD